MIIAIDGEASTGKSTQAKKIAKRLNINYRDSGAYYRAITLFLIQNQINPKEIIGSDIFSKIDISQKFENNIFSIFLNGQDVTSKIRGHKVSLNVSEYAKKPEIRKFVYNLLRKSSCGFESFFDFFVVTFFRVFVSVFDSSELVLPVFSSLIVGKNIIY